MVFKFISNEEEVSGVHSFNFEAPERLDWLPGQYMHYVLQLNQADERGGERWFTISTAPFEKIIRITTRTDGAPSSSFKQRLLEMMPGDTIEADGPKGKFVLDEAASGHVMIAGGIGITPFRSMLAQLAHDTKPANAHLLYANRDENFVFDDELASIAAKDDSLKIKKFIDQRIGRDDLAPLVTAGNVFYLSGPKAMVEAYEGLLAELGVASDNIRTDYFPGY